MSLVKTGFGKDHIFLPEISSTGLASLGYYLENRIFFGPLLSEYQFPLDSLPVNNLYNKGLQDAKIFYKNKGAFWGTYAATVVTVFVPYS